MVRVASPARSTSLWPLRKSHEELRRDAASVAGFRSVVLSSKRRDRCAGRCRKSVKVVTALEKEDPPLRSDQERGALGEICEIPCRKTEIRQRVGTMGAITGRNQAASLARRPRTRAR